MRLNLDHVLSLSEIFTPLMLSIVLGCLVLALLVLAFTHKWLGLVLGILLLSGGIGVGAVLGVQVKENTSTHRVTEVLSGNGGKVQTWAAATYKLKLTTGQAKALASGTESYSPIPTGQQQFGTIQAVSIQVTGGDISVPITLFYNKGIWTLAYTNASGAYTRLPVQS